MLNIIVLTPPVSYGIFLKNPIIVPLWVPLKKPDYSIFLYEEYWKLWVYAVFTPGLRQSEERLGNHDSAGLP